MTEEQQSLHDFIEVNLKLQRELMQRCEAVGHSIVPNGTVAVCEVCGLHLGIYCGKGPNHTCHFIIDDDNKVICKHCGRPSPSPSSVSDERAAEERRLMDDHYVREIKSKLTSLFGRNDIRTDLVHRVCEELENKS